MPETEQFVESVVSSGTGLRSIIAPEGSVVLALDMDGVIVHSLERGRKWHADLMRDLGIDPSYMATGYFQKYWPDVVTGRADIRQTLAAFLLDAGSPVGVDDLIKYWFENDANIDSVLVDEVVKWRKMAPNRLLVAVSNQERLRVRYLSNMLRLRDTLDGAFWSCDLGLTKSSEDFYRVVNSEFLAHSDRVIFFDDEQKHLTPAIRSGWEAHLYTDVEHLLGMLASTRR